MASDAPPPIDADDHVAGPGAGERILIQYGDYECPFCARDERGLRSIRGRHATELKFVFRHFPLRSEHPNAQRAAELAESAAEQGLFWELHEAMMDAPAPLTDERILALAAPLGIDTERLLATAEGGRFAERVQRDLDGGASSGVSGTPWYFLDGRRTAPLARISKRLSAPAAGA